MPNHVSTSAVLSIVAAVSIACPSAASGAINRPTNLRATIVSSSRIDLAWTDNSGNEAAFKIYRALSSAGPWVKLGSVRSNMVTYVDTGVQDEQTYYYRVRAVYGSVHSPYSNIASATTQFSVPAAKGIYLLDNRQGEFRLASLKNTNRSWIDGWAWRMSWTAFDSGTRAPNYNFSAVTTAITQLQAMNKKLSLLLNVQEVPDYALRDAQDTYVTKVPYWLYTATTSVSWDAPTQSHYRNFLRALASHQVFDSAAGRLVPLRDHPTLGPIRAGVLGRTHVARDQFRDLLRMPGYTREKYLDAVNDCLTAVQDEFPSKSIHVGFFDIKDNIKSPGLDSALLDSLLGTFDGTARPRIGFFEECLTGDRPTPTGTYGRNLVRARDAGSPILFQALGSWLDHNPGNWTPGDDSPANGFQHAYDVYGTRYFEMYVTDLHHEPFRALFQEWRDFLAALPD